MGIAILFQLSIVFFVSFALTLPWYVKGKSVAYLFAGAVVQPILTAFMFSLETGLLSAHFGIGGNFEGFFAVVATYTIVISVPLALLCSAFTPLNHAQTSECTNHDINQHVGFLTLVVAGGISLVIASTAAGLFIARTL